MSSCLHNFVCSLTALLLVTAAPASARAANGPPVERQTDVGQKSRIFHGAWFDVRYPADFTAKPSLRSATAEGYDSAEFISPDGAVSFYVFAPQWGGDASDIALLLDREKLVTERRRKVRDGEIYCFTIAAKDGSYLRSYQETVTGQGSVKTIVGIKYRSEKARLRHSKEHQLFRKSVKLFAD